MTEHGDKFDRCPKAWANQDMWIEQNWIVDFYRLQKTGILPRAGGWLDQDPLWADAVDVINGEGIKHGKAQP